MYVNQGVSDMELPRIAGMEKEYSNLVMVPEKVVEYRFVAFSRDVKDVYGWDDLGGQKVGYLIGWKIFDNNVPSTAEVTKLSRPELLFDMLEKGRLDLALYEKYAGWENVRSHGHFSVKECPTPLAVKPMYIYLHASRKDLAPCVAEALRKMKADGTYQRIADQTLGRY